jgi:hypothetical protein
LGRLCAGRGLPAHCGKLVDDLADELERARRLGPERVVDRILARTLAQPHDRSVDFVQNN